MNVLQTSWDDADYTAATVFVSVAGGATVTIPANDPVDVRSMHDSVLSGSYYVAPSAIAGGADQTSVTATVATINAACTWNGAGTPSVTITAASSATTIATVSASAVCNTSGTAVFTVTKVTTGTTTITLTGPGTSATDTVVITFT